MSRDKLVIAMLLAVAFLACMPTISAATNPPPVQFFYVPVPEGQWLQALQVIQAGGFGSTPSNPMQSYISISAVADNTIIYYDQYENGYEPDIGNPLDVYSSSNLDGTQIWGDGDTSNGAPPGVSSDIINEGTVIVLNNPVTTTDPITVIKYGGRDKIAATKSISVVRAGWSTGPNTLMADANEVYDTDNWGTDFRVPVGTNIPDGTDYQMFQYTGMAIMAGKGGATVQIDANADATFETTVTLAEGQSHLINNGLSVGARVISNNPVQVDLITGNIATSTGYESRFFRLLPTNLWTTSYYTPVSTPTSAQSYNGVATTVWLYNPSSTAITVQYQVRTSATTVPITSLSVPANGYLKQVLPNGYGAHFYTTGGQKFYALSTTNSGNSGTSTDYYNSIWDWGFALVPESSLTPQLLIGLGIGRDPTSSTNPTENGNPIWVTPIGNGNTPVTIYVDYDANPATGSLTDPNGNKYNVALSLRELEQGKVYDTIDRDQTGMLLYTLDGTKLVGAWGEDPLTASAAAPGVDMGTGIPPLPLFDDGKTASLYEDRDNDGYISPGDVLLYTIVINNIARSPLNNVRLQDSFPIDAIYVEGSTYLNKSATGITTSIPDSGATTFPLDEGGVILDGGNALPVGKSYTITFRAIIKDFVDLTPCMTEVVNTGNATANNITIPFEARTPIYGRIGDFVWADANANGIQDIGELGVANVTINLLDGSGNPVLDVFSNPITTVTNASGFYQFLGLLPGNYTVEFIKPTGYDFTLKDQGQDDALDSDADLLTGRTSAIMLAAGENNSMMDAGLFQLIPEIDIEKYTNGEDADDPTGPFIPIGSTVTWTYNVTNNGNVNLTNVAVTDNMGVTPAYVSGDNGNNILEPGEVWVYSATGVATEGQYANIGNVSADYSGTPVNDTDESHYFGSNSSVDIEKYTNGEDADDPTGPFIPIGSTVTWTYNVTNNGNVNLTNVAVTDNMGVTPAYVNGDNGNNILEPGEVWVYSATGVATEGQYANIGNVTGYYNEAPVTDEDPSHYFGSNSSVDIEKYTNGEDADDPTGPFIPIGSTVTWTYNVTNNGNVNLTNVAVTDNMGVTPAYVSGDNGDGILQPGEVWVYSATGVATEGQYANIGNVSADYSGTPVNDTDESHYFGSNSSVDIEKYTNGEDADDPTGPFIPIGSTVTWTYNVTNNGNVNLTNVAVTDNMGVTPAYVSGDNGDGILQPGEVWVYSATGVATEGQYANIGNVTGYYNEAPVTDEDPSHYFGSNSSVDIEKYTNGEDADDPTGPFIPIGSTVTWTYNVTNNGNVNLTNVAVTDNMGVTPAYVSGDNGNNILEPGEVWVYSATGVATEGQYANIGNVTGYYNEAPVTDEDPSHYFGSNSSVDIEKYTNGEDADDPTGPFIPIGSTVTWTYNVTNNGNVNLTNVAVTDNMGVTPAYVNGDNGNNILEPGEVWVYSATGVATEGQYANIGNVTGYYNEAPVTDEDPSHYFGSNSSVDIEKYTNGEDADDPTGPFIPIGSTVTWTYNVTNNGNVNLTNVAVTDNMGVTPAYVNGDNGNNILEPGEVWVYSATGVATEGQYANIGNVTGYYNEAPVTDEDPSHYFGSNSSVDIEKYTNGEDADDPTGPFIPIGSTVTWTYNVTNNGNVNLTNVAVTDNMGVTPAYVNGDNGNNILEPGEVWVYSATGVATEGQYANIGNVTGYYNEAPVTDEDPSHYFGLSGAIDIEKYVWNGTGWEDADTVTGPSLPSGPVKFKIIVTNIGNVELTGINVTDDKYGPVTLTTTTLAVGASTEAEYDMVWASGQQVNTAEVEGYYGSTKYTDSDDAHYYGPVSQGAQYDNRLRESSSCVVFSKAEYLDVGKNVSRSRDVLWFDLSKFNKEDKVSKATLSLFWYYPEGATRPSDTVVDIYRPIKWDPNYVTWYYVSQNKKWPIVGGTWFDKNNVSQGSTPYGSVTFRASTVPDNKYYEFDVTQLVQQYINGTYENTGFFLKARTESGNYIAFYSSDWTNPDQRPKLTVSLESAPAPTIVAPTAPVDEAPVAEAGSYQTVITGSTVSFDGSGSTDDNGIVLYSWDFDDGATAEDAVATASHAYTTAGTYTVNLTVTDTIGQKDSDTMQVVVNDPSSATTPTDCTSSAVVADNRLRQTSPSTVYATTTYIDVGKGASTSRDVMMFDLSAYEPNTVSKATLSLYWYYENPRTSDTVVDIYRPAEEWDPKYVSWNNRASGKLWTTAGGDWFDKNNVLQGSTPYASVTFPKGTAPDNRYYEFDVTKLVQEYTNGTYKNTGFFLKARTESGNYIAFYSSDYSNAAMRPKLTVCIGGASAPTAPVAPTLPVDEAPVAEAGANQTVTTGSTVSFDGSGSTDDSGIELYSWDFGDGATATGVSVTHAYTTAGTYTVNLTVTDTIGQKDSDTLKVVVNDPVGPVDNAPVADAGEDQATTTGSSISFDGSGSTDDKGIVLYSWDFDDGTTSTGVSVTHAYTTAGTYTVTLNVTDESSQSDSDTLKVVVSEPTTPTGSDYAVGVADNRLRQNKPNVVYSTTTYIDIGKSQNSTSRDVMLFDLSAYKPTDTISKATLSLYWYYAESGRTSDTVVDIYRPAEKWDSKYVSWNNRVSGVSWTTTGGNWSDMNGVSQGNTPYASVTFPKGMTPDNKYYEFDVTELVRAYIRGDYENTGFFLKARTEDGNYIAFYSLDYPDPAMRPKLTITR